MLARISVTFLVIMQCAVGQVVVGTSAESTSSIRERQSAANAAPSTTQRFEQPLTRWGQIEFRPGISLNLTRVSGLRNSSGVVASSNISTIAADFLVRRGNLWSVDYSIASIDYSGRDFRDTASQYFRANYQLSRPGWTLEAEQSYGSTDQTEAETGRQTKQQVVASRATASVQLGERWLWSNTGEQRLTFTEAFADIYEWSIQPMLNYSAAKGLSLGAGANVGYVLLYHASDMVYVTPVATLKTQLTRKTAVEAELGLDNWRLIAGTKRTTTAAHGRLQIRFDPTQTTTITAEGERLMMAVPYRDQIGQSNRASLQFRQRFFTHLELHVAPTFEQLQYRMDNPFILTAREDRIRSIDISFSTALRHRLRVALLYRYSRNQSNSVSTSYSTQQFGVRCLFHY